MNNYFRKIKASYLLLLVATILIIIGIKNGDINEIYNKARFICLECIGIG